MPTSMKSVARQEEDTKEVKEKKYYTVRMTHHYSDYFLIEIDGESEHGEEREQDLCTLIQQEMVSPYAENIPRADDCAVDITEVSEEDIQRAEHTFSCKRVTLQAIEMNQMLNSGGARQEEQAGAQQ